MGDHITATQNSLGTIIKAPKLTEKLLNKPPFRFLHDIVTSFLKTTGFPEGYFTPDELDSGKVSDKESKVAFLIKLIAIIEAGCGETVNAKPGVIVTGAEPENTCDMLIKLAACAKLSKDQMKTAVQRALGGPAEEAPAPPPAKPESPPPPAPEEKPKPESPPPQEEKPKPKPERKPKPAPADDDTPNVPAVQAISAQQEARPGTASARKPPPALKSNEVVEERHEPSGAGVILERKESAEKKEERDWQAVVEEEEQAARAREAKSGSDAKGYLGRQAQDAMKEQEAKQQKEKEEAEAAGRRTEGIVLNSRRRTDKAGGAMGESELTKLREQLQLLTKATNPLGKFLEAIHEDIDTMSRELEMWRTEARTQAAAAADAQRQTEESLHEVYGRLHAVEDQISDQLVKINLMRQTILQNDQTVETLLKMVVNPEVGGKKKQ